MNDAERLAELSARLERVNPRSHARRTDPATSKEAGYSLDPTKLEAKVLRIITNFGSHGCISDQVEHEMMKVFEAKFDTRLAPMESSENHAFCFSAFHGIRHLSE